MRLGCDCNIGCSGYYLFLYDEIMSCYEVGI